MTKVGDAVGSIAGTVAVELGLIASVVTWGIAGGIWVAAVCVRASNGTSKLQASICPISEITNATIRSL
jgi:hypothetical protein